MITWVYKKYNDLSIDELYSILKIRQQVFIIEQACNYLDADGYDQKSMHLIAYKQNSIVAYMRIVNAGEIDNNISFGRILVHKKFRKRGIGHQLVMKGINFFAKNETIVMSAQCYLERFYNNLGFQKIGSEYLEDNIPHVKMIRNG